MINSAVKKNLLFPEIKKNLGADHGMQLAANGQEAAIRVLTLMRDTAGLLAPRSIIEREGSGVVLPITPAGRSVPRAVLPLYAGVPPPQWRYRRA
jgi:hypothetical protein